MGSPKWFYVLYPQHSQLRKILNALKVIADHTQRTEAHITVRGPYRKRLPESDVSRYSDMIEGEHLRINKVDNFFAFGQNTVFFNCEENDNLKKIWRKITYNEFRPHITIYDGDDRDFAVELFQILGKAFRPFIYQVEKLSWLEPKTKDELRLYSLENSFNFDTIQNLINTELTKDSVENLAQHERMNFIELIANELYKSFNEYTIANKH
jgi:2'-5' RNA ligase